MNTTNLTELLKSASLTEMLADVIATIKAKPTDTDTRELLFKLYCIDGSWQKALLQLETLTQLLPEFTKQAELYKNLILSEKMRDEVLAGKRSPGTLGNDLPEWVALLQQANQLHHDGDHQQSEALREQALQQAPESIGESAATGCFAWIADSDGRMGPVCEFISAGGYRWIPFAEIQSLTVSKPKNITDLIWAPAQVKVKDKVWYGYIPARYPLTPETDNETKLGLKTEWHQPTDSLYIGAGRKMFITDQGEHALFDIEEIVFEIDCI
ncbi:ImpE family T6SS protein Cts1E [Yersinia pestis]|uniref:Protein of avirulence locus ImpE n=10 Tax=Yersinia pestis TaxID=632 RepID=A0A3G5L591_YERPE|nr:MULTISPECIES: type VI secretion system accessory protein TagJ [Yersinia pseudotuberculosis complex]EDR33555.1 ImpE family protein [Yersinia pestis biovar Orientalis str. IP275]EFA49365.1 ImpE protein [Yersinia pestis KIM D27]ERP71385.1 impE family protein [Yersinia pestis S3]ERP72108.1 impE family protein [Yersinia pestis 24H]ERP82137.1 impE family protein [Yersinia pestis 9]